MRDVRIKDIVKLVKHYARKAKRYAVIAFIITVTGLYSFLIFQISQASQAEPSQDVINQQLTAVKRLRIDQQSIDKIQQLQDQSVGVQSLFEAARDNPFQE